MTIITVFCIASLLKLRGFIVFLINSLYRPFQCLCCLFYFCKSITTQRNWKKKMSGLFCDYSCVIISLTNLKINRKCNSKKINEESNDCKTTNRTIYQALSLVWNSPVFSHLKKTLKGFWWYFGSIGPPWKGLSWYSLTWTPETRM